MSDTAAIIITLVIISPLLAITLAAAYIFIRIVHHRLSRNDDND